MNKSQIDNVLPEQELSNEQKAETNPSSPNIANTPVAPSFSTSPQNTFKK